MALLEHPVFSTHATSDEKQYPDRFWKGDKGPKLQSSRKWLVAGSRSEVCLNYRGGLAPPQKFELDGRRRKPNLNFQRGEGADEIIALPLNI